jgi:hypothetical protein
MLPVGERNRSYGSKAPFIRINWDSEPSGYAENPDYWIFLREQGTMVGLNFVFYYLQFVSASKPFDHV